MKLRGQCTLINLKYWFKKNVGKKLVALEATDI